jgi:hypothetical protein
LISFGNDQAALSLIDSPQSSSVHILHTETGLHFRSTGKGSVAQYSRSIIRRHGKPFPKNAGTSLYAGVRLIPVTGTSHDYFGANIVGGILEELISLKPASLTGLSLGAGRGSRTPKSRSSADFEGTEMIYSGIL